MAGQQHSVLESVEDTPGSRNPLYRGPRAGGCEGRIAVFDAEDHLAGAHLVRQPVGGPCPRGGGIRLYRPYRTEQARSAPEHAGFVGADAVAQREDIR